VVLAVEIGTDISRLGLPLKREITSSVQFFVVITDSRICLHPDTVGIPLGVVNTSPCGSESGTML